MAFGDPINSAGVTSTDVPGTVLAGPPGSLASGDTAVFVYGYYVNNGAEAANLAAPTVSGTSTGTFDTPSITATRSTAAGFLGTNLQVGIGMVHCTAPGTLVLQFDISGSGSRAISILSQEYDGTFAFSTSYGADGSGTTRSDGGGTASAAGAAVCATVGDGSGDVNYSGAVPTGSLDASQDNTSHPTTTLQHKVVTGAGSVAAMTITSDQSSGWSALTALFTDANGAAGATPSGFGLTASLGTPTVALVNNPTVHPTGFGLTVSRGTPTAGVTQSPTITPNGLSLTALLGSPTVIRGGSITVQPTGLSATVVLGTQTLAIVSNPTVQPTGFGLTVNRGTFTTETDVTIKDIPGFGLTTTLGTSSITRSPVVQPTGYSLSTSLGTPTILLSQRLTPSGFGLSTTLGTPSLVLEPTILPAGLSVSIGLGSVAISSDSSITQIPQGFALPVTLGAATIVIDNNPILQPAGFGVSTALGNPTVALSPTIVPSGFALLASLGSATLGGDIAMPSGALTGQLRVRPRLTATLRVYPTE